MMTFAKSENKDFNADFMNTCFPRLFNQYKYVFIIFFFLQ